MAPTLGRRGGRCPCVAGIRGGIDLAAACHRIDSDWVMRSKNDSSGFGSFPMMASSDSITAWAEADGQGCQLVLIENGLYAGCDALDPFAGPVVIFLVDFRGRCARQRGNDYSAGLSKNDCAHAHHHHREPRHHRAAGKARFTWCLRRRHCARGHARQSRAASRTSGTGWICR